MANSDSRWIFSSDLIENTQSRKDGIDKEQELSLRQSTAMFIHELGYKLKVTQICINTAIIYMHRFYMIHSFKKFHRNSVAASCLFFACKVEEHPTPLHRFIEAIHQLLHANKAPLDSNSDEYKLRWEEIIAHESCLLQTLGFNVLIQHAHTIIIKTCQMIKAPRDLAQTAYFMATNSLILTNFCIKFPAEKVACFCIYLACKWTALKIPTSTEGREWFQYVNPNITVQQLEEISEEYLAIYDKCPAKIKKKLGFDQKQNEEDAQRIKQTQQSKPPSTHQPSSSTNPSESRPPSSQSQQYRSSQQADHQRSSSSSRPPTSASQQQQANKHPASKPSQPPPTQQHKPSTQPTPNKVPQNRPPSSQSTKSHENYHSTKIHYSNGNQNLTIEEKRHSFHNQQPVNKTSMKRENDDLNGGSQAPTKMPKYVTEKSAIS